jgi:hypothetical protein
MSRSEAEAEIAAVRDAFWVAHESGDAAALASRSVGEPRNR